MIHTASSRIGSLFLGNLGYEQQFKDNLSGKNGPDLRIISAEFIRQHYLIRESDFTPHHDHTWLPNEWQLFKSWMTTDLLFSLWWSSQNYRLIWRRTSKMAEESSTTWILCRTRQLTSNINGGIIFTLNWENSRFINSIPDPIRFTRTITPRQKRVYDDWKKLDPHPKNTIWNYAQNDWTKRFILIFLVKPK